jgi:UDP-N-acetylglucosamine acyltransferase
MANIIHPTAIVHPNVILGDNNYIGAYCIIGDPAEHRKYWGGEIGKVWIGDNNIITGLVTIDAGTTDTTFIAHNCFIMKHAHIGHDCRILSNVTISCGAKIGGHSIIEQYSNIGLNAVLHQFSKIAKGCMIGASAFFKGESEILGKYAGVPAKKIGINEHCRNLINPK